MPDSKTIEIDEIVPAEKSGGGDAPSRNRTRSGAASGSAAPGFDPTSSANPFADLENSLPWKARWTLRLTRWFMLLRSKPWGKLVIVPAVILGLLLALPLGLLFFCVLIIRSFLRSFR